MGKRVAAAVVVCGLLLVGWIAPPDPVAGERESPLLESWPGVGPAAALYDPGSESDFSPADASSPPGSESDAGTVTIADRTPERTHVDVHGLYMTGWTAGSSIFYDLIAYMKKSGLNAVVIDAQDDDGALSWETEIPLAIEIGANEQKIPDIDARVEYLHENGIYCIARIVVYADPLLGRKRPDMAISGGTFADSRGIRWPDPYNRQVWAYKAAIAREAALRGFDEVQFDYIRFPESLIEGYNAGVPAAQRTAAITDFLRYARAELQSTGIFVSADVFGLTTSVEAGDDMEIGQDYAQIAATADYILPMLYPSHFAPGTYGIPDPNQEPGETVYQAMRRALERTAGMDVKKHRPWIQDFNYGKRYSAADVEAQIRGLARAGIYQWILWDPNNVYTRTVDYSVGDLPGGPGGWSPVSRPAAWQ